MNDFVVIKTHTYACELDAMRALLETQGIACLVKDELTSLADPLISNAIGGIKLMVSSAEAGRAIEILIEHGYLQPEDLQPSASEMAIHRMVNRIHLWLDNMTSKIPLINRMQLGWRMIVISVICILLLSWVVIAATSGSIHHLSSCKFPLNLLTFVI